MKLRIAVVGAGSQAGSRARTWLDTISRLQRSFDLCAIVDVDRAVLDETVERYRAAAGFTDLRQMLAEARPDLVLGLAQTDSQSVVAIAAARQGVHVMTEIPVGITLQVADAVAAECRAHGTSWTIAEQVWLWPAERLKRRIVETGLLGTPIHARLWYMTGAYHGFNVVRKLLGREATRVLGHHARLPAEPYLAYGGEPMSSVDLESALIEFDGGLVCFYEKPPRPFPTHAARNLWEIEATRGHLSGSRLTLYEDGGERVYDIREVYERQDGAAVLREVRVDTEPPLAWNNPFFGDGIGRRDVGGPDDVAKAQLLAGVHRAITEGTDPPYGWAEARRDLEIWFAVRESARHGSTWLGLPLTEPTVLEERIRDAYVQRYGHDPAAGAADLVGARFNRSSVLWAAAGWL